MSSTPLLHVLGGGPWQLPTIRRAKSLGFRVLVTDGFAERPGFALADVSEVVDLLDPDRTLEAAQRHRIDGILCDTTDTGVRTAAFVADRLGLPGVGLRAAEVCTDKSLLRQALASRGLPCPAFRVASSLVEAERAAGELGWPLAVKPVDNQSGRGVRLVTGVQDLADAARIAFAHSRKGLILLEEAVQGVEHVVDGFVSDEGLVVLGIASKSANPANPTIATRILYRTGAAFDAVHRSVRPILDDLLEAIGFGGGVFHAEFMVDSGRATLIDLAARGGGVMIYSHVLQAVAGVDPVEAMIRSALGEHPVVRVRQRRAACIDFLQAPAGQVVQELVGVDKARARPGILGVHMGIEAGEAVSELTSKDARPGYVVGAGDDEAMAAAAVRRARADLAFRLAASQQWQSFEAGGEQDAMV